MSVSDKLLNLAMGFSHPVNMVVPEFGETQTTPITISGRIEGSSETVKVIKDDGLYVETLFEDLFLSYIEGRMNERKVVIDETETGVTLPIKFGGLEGLKLGDARFTMNVYNTIAFPLRIAGELKAISSTGETFAVNFDEKLTSSNGSEISTQLRPFENGDADILDFINLPPEKITFASNGYIGDGIAIASVSAEDYMRADYSLEIAAKAVWEKRSFVVDTTRILIEPEFADLDIKNIDKSFDSETTKNLKKLVLHAFIENHTPAGLHIRFRFANNLEQLEESPQLVLGPIIMSSAETNSSGIVTKSVSSQAELLLDEDALKLFQNPTTGPKYVYIATDLEIQDSDGKEVQLFSTDYIRLQSYMNVVVNVHAD